jgi:hypothetical protein
MPLDNLAKVLGPTVVGTASKLTHLQQQIGGVGSNGVDCHSYHYMEASKQVEILYALLNLENVCFFYLIYYICAGNLKNCSFFQNYWTAFYNWQPENLQNNQGCLGSITPHGTAATIKRIPINQRYQFN